MQEKLTKLLQRAYAPYSNVQVSAIVVTKNDNQYNGVNVENASYGGTICAERNAIWSAIAAGAKPGDFQTLHLSSSLPNFLFPCGLCRQVMSEFFDQTTKIHLYHKQQVQIFTLEDLLPHRVNKTSFGW